LTFDADADDGVAEGRGRGRRGVVGCGVYEDAAAFAGRSIFSGEEEVVGPTDVDLVAHAKACNRGDSRLHGDGGGERELRACCIATGGAMSAVM